MREVGEKDIEEEVVLDNHYKQMLRTMLWYANEKFNEALRSNFSLGQI